MATGLDRFVARARERGLEIAPRRFGEGTRTAAGRGGGHRLRRRADREIVKSLVFVADGAPVLVLTSGANRVDEARLAEHLRAAAAVRKASADEVRRATGLRDRGTPPFGHDDAPAGGVRRRPHRPRRGLGRGRHADSVFGLAGQLVEAERRRTVPVAS
jgi:hypothetical protein